MSKKVLVTCEFVNMVPAHNRFITKTGEGSNISVAIGRGVDAVFKDARVKGKRAMFPIKFTVQAHDESLGSRLLIAGLLNQQTTGRKRNGGYE